MSPISFFKEVTAACSSNVVEVEWNTQFPEKQDKQSAPETVAGE